MTQLTGPGDGVPRDRWGRPLVIPPVGGKPMGYRRCTTFVKALDDTYQLDLWKQRMVATGLAARPDLLALVHTADKKKLNSICADALEAAKASASANTGTALHALTELVDRGEPLPAGVSPELRADVDAYQRARDAAKLEPVLLEKFVVFDSFKVGGTFDRLYRTHNGQYLIGDLKTGSIDYSAATISMQLAVYNHSVMYDHTTHARTPLPSETSKDLALIVHLPAGQATCRIMQADTSAEGGWKACILAHRVWDWRDRKDLVAPYLDLEQMIGDADTIDALEALYFQHADNWTDAHTELASARKTLISAGVLAAEGAQA